MSSRTEQQFESIRNEKIKQIKNTALQLFSEYGYENTSISAIAKKAGMSKGLLYHYFSGKEELLKEIMVGGLKEFMAYLKIENTSSIKKEELIEFIDGNLVSLKQNTDYYRLYFALVFQPGIQKLFEQEFMSIFMEIFDKFMLYFKQKNDSSPYVKARYLLAVFDGIGIHYITDPKGFPLDEIRDLIVEQL